jgi:hypothetical protein
MREAVAVRPTRGAAFVFLEGLRAMKSGAFQFARHSSTIESE